MRGPEYVLEKAQNRYRSVWRDALMGADPGAYAVALDPPSAAAITTRAGDVSAWLIHWRQWAAQHPERYPAHPHHPHQVRRPAHPHPPRHPPHRRAGRPQPGHSRALAACPRPVGPVAPPPARAGGAALAGAHRRPRQLRLHHLARRHYLVPRPSALRADRAKRSRAWHAHQVARPAPRHGPRLPRHPHRPQRIHRVDGGRRPRRHSHRRP